jgi:V8-like Glu-specific endopeptidase
MRPLFSAFAGILGITLLTLVPVKSQEKSVQTEIKENETIPDFNTLVMRATVKVSHEKSTGAGFLLSAADGKKFILVTAAHALEGTPGNETSVVFRRKESEGVYQKRSVKLNIRKDGKPLWTKHPTEDVAAMWIVPPKDAELPRVPLSLVASDKLLTKYHIHPGENLACLGYPHNNESSDAGFPILRGGPIASFPLVPTKKTKTFFLSANTFEGDSGGPVYLTRPGCSLIMGIITGQRMLDEEAKMVYGTTKLRHRLGLAVVVHGSFIRETIDRLP